MSAATDKQQSVIPSLPRSSKVIDQTGSLTSEWKLFFEQLILALQGVLKAEGITLPQQTAANISLLTTVNSLGNILYNSTANSFMANVQTAPGVYTWKTVTLT